MIKSCSQNKSATPSQVPVMENVFPDIITVRLGLSVKTSALIKRHDKLFFKEFWQIK